MEIPIGAAKAQVTDLVRRAEAGDEVIQTGHGQAAVRLVPVTAKPARAAKKALLKSVRAGAAKARSGPGAAPRTSTGVPR